MATSKNRKNPKVEQSDAFAALVGYIRGVNAPQGTHVEPIGLTEAQQEIFTRANSEAYGYYSEDIERPRR